MCDIYLVGNPNTGKTTLFNSLTKSEEHVGNWHGVTVSEKCKTISLNDKQYNIYDLPGLYSLNCFSLEEEVSKNLILDNDNKIVYLLDANNFSRNMFLAINLLLINRNIKIVINNYNDFIKRGGQIDIDGLSKVLGCEIEIINAKKIKPTNKFFEFATRKTKFVKSIEQNIQTLDEYGKIEVIYKFINILKNKYIIKKVNSIYGFSKFDKRFLKLSFILPLFLMFVLLSIFITFFVIGPIISEFFLNILDVIIAKPVMNIISNSVKSKFIISLFSEGVFGACFSVLGFLPQICLMYLFLSILENSGIISRLAFLLDDLFEKLGLNGKMIYTMLMGFGCSTTATLTANNMPDKNSKIKAGLLTPFMSCSARLPIYTTVAGVLCGINSVWVVFMLYLLGVLVALILAYIFNKTILPSNNTQFVIEFPSLKAPNLSTVFLSMKVSCKQFISKVFGVIFSVSVIIWLLNNVNIKFQYVGVSNKSILYSFSSLISWMFKPIGLNNPNIICALIIGIVAKELILSSFAVSNKITNLSLLSGSLLLTSSAVNFNIATGITFLVFTLLYFPCVSNFGVLLKEIGPKYTMFGVILQLALAYTIAYLTYILLTKGLAYALVIVIAGVIIGVSIYSIYLKIKNKNLTCCFCSNINDCKKSNKCKTKND